MANKLPSFTTLLQRFHGEHSDQARHDERDRLINYLELHGQSVASVNDIYHAVLTLDHEEELSAFKCREGIAVSHASDGWWLLFRNNEPIRAPHRQPAGVGGC